METAIFNVAMIPVIEHCADCQLAGLARNPQTHARRHVHCTWGFCATASTSLTFRQGKPVSAILNVCLAVEYVTCGNSANRSVK